MYNLNRTSMALPPVPVAKCESVEACLDHLRGRGYTNFHTEEDDKNPDHFDVLAYAWRPGRCTVYTIEPEREAA